MQPTQIKRNDTKGLTITWSDGSTTSLTSETLRRNCPCAACKEERGDTTHAKPLTGKKRSLMIIDSSASEQTKLLEIWGVGQYAIGLRWADGHNTGIYTFPYLKEIGGLSSPITEN
jgi:DUF971 family protein